MIELQVNPINIDFWTLTSIIASIVSVIIGGFAIWLSVVFYKLTSKVSDETKEASRSLASSVQKLETLFDKLYSDTFGMMKDTVTDMRNHIWTKEYTENDLALKVEEKASEKIVNIKKELNNELSELVKRVGKTEEKVDSFKDISGIIEKAISQTRKVENEVQKEVLTTDILNDVLHTIISMLPMKLRDVYEIPKLLRKYSRSQIKNCIMTFVEDKVIVLDGPINNISSILRPGFNENENDKLK